MSGLFNGIYNAVVSNSLVDALYHKTSSLVSSVYSNLTPIATVGLLGINLASMTLGDTTSRVTKEYVQLNNFVPQSIRKFLRGFGEVIVRANNRIDSRISKKLRVNKEFIGTIITGPIFEELVFRLPLLLASWQISDMTSEFFCLPILEGVAITGAQATMAVLAILSSVAFTYAHDDKPSPDRAAGVFGVGLTLSYLTLSSDKGLINAIGAHMIHNLTSHGLGMQKIRKGILPKDPEKEIESAEKDFIHKRLEELVFDCFGTLRASSLRSPALRENGPPDLFLDYAAS